MKTPALSLHTLSELIEKCKVSHSSVPISGTSLVNEQDLLLECRDGLIYVVSNKFSLDEYLGHFNSSCYSPFAEGNTELLLEKLMHFELRGCHIKATSKKTGTVFAAVFHNNENIVAVIGDDEEMTFSIEDFVTYFEYQVPDVTTPIAKDDSYTIEMFWSDVERLGWGRDHNYNRIEKELLRSLSLPQIASFKQHASSLTVKISKIIAAYEKEHDVQFLGDNAFSYTPYHVVGMGKNAYEAFLSFDGDLEEYIDTLSTRESFNYAIPYISDCQYPYYPKLEYVEPDLYFKANALMYKAILSDIDLEELGRTERESVKQQIDMAMKHLDAVVSGEHSVTTSLTKEDYSTLCFSSTLFSKSNPGHELFIAASVSNLISGLKKQLIY